MISDFYIIGDCYRYRILVVEIIAITSVSSDLQNLQPWSDRDHSSCDCYPDDNHWSTISNPIGDHLPSLKNAPIRLWFKKKNWVPNSDLILIPMAITSVLGDHQNRWLRSDCDHLFSDRDPDRDHWSLIGDLIGDHFRSSKRVIPNHKWLIPKFLHQFSMWNPKFWLKFCSNTGVTNYYCVIENIFAMRGISVINWVTAKWSPIIYEWSW